MLCVYWNSLLENLSKEKSGDRIGSVIIGLGNHRQFTKYGICSKHARF